MDGKKYNLHHYWDSDALDLMFKNEIGKNYTMDDAVAYFYNYSMYESPALCKDNMTTYIYEEANRISNENCKIVWDTDNPDYKNMSIASAKTLVSRSISTLQCLLDTMMGASHAYNYHVGWGIIRGPTFPILVYLACLSLSPLCFFFHGNEVFLSELVGFVDEEGESKGC